jgi:hypothetical protein
VKASDLDLALDKAMQMGLIEVTELKSAEVNRGRIYNRGKRPVFVMAGEMLRGGQQDRIASDDLIIPAKSEIVIPVFCVEHGRWTGRGAGFSVGHSVGGAGVRGAARAGGQSAVWSSVAESQRRLRAPSATGALRSVHDSEEVRERMKPYLRALSGLLDDNPKAVGVVAAIGNEIVVADLFSSPDLLRQMWDELLEAYIIDALEQEDPGKPPDAVVVRKWLAGIATAPREEKDTPGDGHLYELNSRAVAGSALIYHSAVVHMGLFPELPAPEPDFNPLQFRRDRLQGE